MKNTRLRVGIAGLGRMGQRHAFNLAHRTLGATLVAACSPIASELEWARDKLGVKHLYGQYKDLLAHPELDAVFLVTPTTLHAEQIIQGLQAGKHVFSEKPLALNIPDCLKVEEEAARYSSQKVMIGFVRRFDPSYCDAYAKVQGGLIGRPFLVRSQTADQNDPSGFFVKFAPTSGGAMLDMCVHDIDVARWFLGAGTAVRVYAAGTIAIHKGLAECGDVDNGVGICEFSDGQIACFYASRTMAHGHETLSEIIGTRGRLTIGQNPRLDRVEIADAAGMRNECTPTFYERFAEAFQLEAQAFVDAVRGDLSVPVTLRDATEATRIGIALTRSLASGRAVDVK